MAKALELVVRGLSETVAFACPVCGTVFTLSVAQHPPGPERARREAEAAGHCAARICECGAALEDKYYTACRSCLQKKALEKEQARFDKAAKLTIEEYDGPLYWEDRSGSLGEGYFAGADEILDYCEQEEVDVPRFVWACSQHAFTLDAESLLEDELERQEMYEGAGEDISDAARHKLQELLDTWSREQKLYAYQPDFSRAVVFHSDGLLDDTRLPDG